MTLPSDMKSYRAPRPLDWLRDLAEQEPALLLVAVIIAALLMDRLA